MASLSSVSTSEVVRDVPPGLVSPAEGGRTAGAGEGVTRALGWQQEEEGRASDGPGVLALPKAAQHSSVTRVDASAEAGADADQPADPPTMGPDPLETETEAGRAEAASLSASALPSAAAGSGRSAKSALVRVEGAIEGATAVEGSVPE